MKRVLRFASAPLGDQARLLVAGGLLLLLPIWVRIAPFSRARDLLVRVGQAAAGIIPGTPTAARIVAAVEIADEFLPWSRSCLVRSLTAETLLHCYGLSPEHRIGVKKQPDGDVMAHSWLEFNGEVVIGDLDELADYDPLPALDRISKP